MVSDLAMTGFYMNTSSSNQTGLHSSVYSVINTCPDSACICPVIAIPETAFRSDSSTSVVLSLITGTDYTYFWSLTGIQSY